MKTKNLELQMCLNKSLAKNRRWQKKPSAKWDQLSETVWLRQWPNLVSFEDGKWNVENAKEAQEKRGKILEKPPVGSPVLKIVTSPHFLINNIQGVRGRFGSPTIRRVFHTIFYADPPFSERIPLGSPTDPHADPLNSGTFCWITSKEGGLC